MARHGCFPGSFDPLTVAHLAIADAARAQCGLDAIDLVLSRNPLGKDHSSQEPLERRVAHIQERTSDRPWLQARVTDHRLLADVAARYDVVIVGADKWDQLHDVRFYDGSARAMRDALGRLPEVAIAPRAGHELPDRVAATVLDVDPAHHHVSSSAVRAGRHEWLA